MNIRAWQPHELPQLSHIFLRAVHETASQHYSPAQIAAWGQVDDAQWRQKLASSVVLVAEVDGKVVGFITAVGHYIDLLFVSPDYARQGIAGALLRALLAKMLPGKVTVAASITAKPFFERQGFVLVREQNVEARGEWFINYLMARDV